MVPPTSAVANKISTISDDRTRSLPVNPSGFTGSDLVEMREASGYQAGGAEPRPDERVHLRTRSLVGVLMLASSQPTRLRQLGALFRPHLTGARNRGFVRP